MKRVYSFLGSALLVAVAWPWAAFASGASVGRTTAVAVVDNGLPISTSSSYPTFLQATIAKGRPRSVLVIHATATATLDQLGPSFLSLSPTVNGLAPSSLMAVSQYCPDVLCLTSATWWADLDDLEVTSPGTIRGKPLDVSVGLADGSVESQSARANGVLTVEMLKK